MTAAYFAEVFARTRRLDPLDAVLDKIFRTAAKDRTLEEKVEAARRFLGVKKKKVS